VDPDIIFYICGMTCRSTTLVPGSVRLLSWCIIYILNLNTKTRYSIISLFTPKSQKVSFVLMT